MMKIKRRNAVTLIELLTVVAILTVLMSIVIPQVRTLTKDRAIREAARTVGAAMNAATSKAQVDGFAGIALMRNLNVARNDEDNSGTINYACYEIFQMARRPSYVGNDIESVAQVGNASNGLLTVEIPTPLAGFAIEPGNLIRFNGSNVSYRVLNASANGPFSLLTCELPLHQEAPAVGTYSFELERLPVIVPSSQIELPQGYVLNLNYSGPVDFNNRFDTDGNQGGTFLPSDWTWTAFSQLVPDPALAEEPVIILFDSNGGIDRMFPNGPNSFPVTPSSSIQLCITPDEIQHSFQEGALSDDMIDGNPGDVLDDPAVLWVTVNHLNGSVIVGENAVPQTTFSNIGDPATVAQEKAQRIFESLSLTTDRGNANQ